MDPETPYPVIDLLPEQKEVEDLGGTMRLGAQAVELEEGTRARETYGEAVVHERHRHRYEVNNQLRARLVEAGLVVSGTFQGGRLVEIVELPDHPWFVASQFHPEFKSRPTRPAPLFREFVGAAAGRARQRGRVSAYAAGSGAPRYILRGMALPAEHDRNRAAATLRRHYLLGRLSVEELSDRLDLAFAARSQRELRQAFRGLPSPWSRSELEPVIENTRYAARRTLQFTVLAGFWSVISLMLLVAFIAVAGRRRLGCRARDRPGHLGGRERARVALVAARRGALVLLGPADRHVQLHPGDGDDAGAVTERELSPVLAGEHGDALADALRDSSENSPGASPYRATWSTVSSSSSSRE